MSSIYELLAVNSGLQRRPLNTPNHDSLEKENVIESGGRSRTVEAQCLSAAMMRLHGSRYERELA